MDNERARWLNEAAQKYAESAKESYETVWDHFARAQEGQAQLTHGLFEEAIAHLRTQAEKNLYASEELAEQGRRGHEAGRVLAQGSADAYAQFVDSLFRSYQESVRLSEREAKKVDGGGPDLVNVLPDLTSSPTAQRRAMHSRFSADVSKDWF